MSPYSRRGWALLGGVLLWATVAGTSLLYASSGGGSRDRLITVLLIDVILVLGLQVFTGNTGVLSFGHAGIAAVGAYATAVLATPIAVKEFLIRDAPLGLAHIQLDSWAATVVGVVLGAVFAGAFGAAVARLSSIAAAIFTLALLVIVHSVVTNWSDLTAGARAFYGIPRITSPTWPLVGALIAILFSRWFRETRLGLRTQAVREDEIAANAVGANGQVLRLITWTIGGTLAALAGSLRAQFLGTISPGEFFLELTIVALAMLILGGSRSVTGAVVGVVAITAGMELARAMGDGSNVFGITLPAFAGLPQIFLGGILVIGMILRPEGLVGDWELDHGLRALFQRTVPRREARQRPASVDAGSNSKFDAAKSSQRALTVLNVGKSFAGLRALHNVSLHVETGEVVGLIGPNGAGKSTLVNIVSGLIPPSHGEVRLDRLNVVGYGPQAIARLGVARTFQGVRLFGELSVRQNIEVAATMPVEGNRPRVAVEEILVEFGFQEEAERRAKTLPYGRQRELEIARAVALSPLFLLLDEPAAGMNEVEGRRLLETMTAFVARTATGVLVIDHDLAFIMAVSERLYVLDHGELIAHGSPEEIQRSPAVVQAYLGSESPARLAKHFSDPDERTALPSKKRS